MANQITLQPVPGAAKGATSVAPPVRQPATIEAAPNTALPAPPETAWGEIIGSVTDQADLVAYVGGQDATVLASANAHSDANDAATLAAANAHANAGDAATLGTANSYTDLQVAGANANANGRVLRSGDQMTGPLNWTADQVLASAATVNIGTAATSNLLTVNHVAGAVNISSFGPGADGAQRLVRFSVAAGTLTLVHGASLVLPNAVNQTVRDGDWCIATCDAGNVWRVALFIQSTDFTRNVVAQATADATLQAAGMTAFESSVARNSADAYAHQTNTNGSTSPSYRNLLDNSAIDYNLQGPALGTAVTTGGAFITDRWKLGVGTAGKVNGSVRTAVAESAQGFYAGPTLQATSEQLASRAAGLFRLTNLNGTAFAAGDYGLLFQSMEGVRLRRLPFGSGSANSTRRMTLSFIARASVTGTYYASIAGAGRSIVLPFTITVANQIQFFSLPFTVDTNSAWTAAILDTANEAAAIRFSVGAGSTFSTATVNAWQAGNFLAANAGQSAWATTNGATFDVGLPQLEAGNGTPFEFMPVDEVVMNCQRYYQVAGRGCIGVWNASTSPSGKIRVKQKMWVLLRDTPAVTLQSTAFYVEDYALVGNNVTGASVTGGGAQYDFFDLELTFTGGVAAGTTQGRQASLGSDVLILNASI